MGSGQVGPGRTPEHGLGQGSCFSLYTSCIFDAHVTNSIYPSVCDHPAHLSNVCLPCTSPSACEPPASLLFLDFTLDPPREGTLSVPPYVPCIPKRQPPPSRPQLSRKPRPLSSRSWNRFYRPRFESRTRSLLHLRLPRFQSQTRVPYSPHFIDHPACNRVGAHLGPSSPFGPSRGSKK